MPVTWNPSDKSADITLSESDMKATASSPTGFAGVRATLGRSSGKWYFEVQVYFPSGNGVVGIGNASETLTYPGDSTDGYGYEADDGNKHHGTEEAYGDSYTSIQIAVAVDLDNGKIWWGQSAEGGTTWQNSGDPETGANPAYTGISGTFYPMVGINTDGEYAYGRFSSADQSSSPPSGFSAWESGEYQESIAAGIGFSAAVEDWPWLARIAPGIGFQAVVEHNEIQVTIAAGIGFSGAVSAQRECYPVIAPQAGFSGAVAPQKESSPEIAAGIGFEAVATNFNWAEWLELYGSLATVRFYLTLTGTADGLSDLELPISTFNYRLRQSTPSYLQVTVPGEEYAAAIAARSNGDMRLEMAFFVSGAEHHREVLAEIDLESIDIYQGTESKSIMLMGHRTETHAAKVVDLSGVSYFAEVSGLRRIRLARPDLYLKPGDTVRWGTEEFTVGYLACVVSPNQMFQEIVEAEV